MGNVAVRVSGGHVLAWNAGRNGLSHIWATVYKCACYPEAVAAREVAFQHIISGGNHGCDDFGDEKVC